MAVAPVTSAPPRDSDAIGRETRRRIAWRLIPFLALLFVVNFLDRTSVAYAALGMSRDLGFDAQVLGTAAGTFFWGYVLMQIPGALLVEHWSARRAIAAVMIAWGSLTALTALVHTPGELYAARFALGAAEGGFFPGVVVYLSHWFIARDRAKATSNFFAAVPLSFVIASPVAGWILGQHWLGLQGWRWLFVAEGLPALVLGVVALRYLTDRPAQAHWLAPDQRRWIQTTLAQQQPRVVATESRWVDALLSPVVLLLAASAFLEYLVGYTVIYFLPTFLEDRFHLSDARVGLVGALPYLAALVTVVSLGWHSDRRRERRWHCAVPLFLAAGALVGLTAHPTLRVAVGLLAVLCSATLSFVPLFWSMPAELLAPSVAAAAIGIINALASVAGFLGPFAFGHLRRSTGSFVTGFGIMAALAVAAGLLILLAPRARPPHP